jgi:NAD(P)-dependent dehydrogenase (short-subunit alcohol dehydrogenase family)
LAFHPGPLYFFDGLMPLSVMLRCGLNLETSLMSSEQKVVIVTGASQGIGASLVKAYRDIGYGVVANSRSIQAGDFAHDPDILTVAGDIASAETAERIFNAAIERFGRIDTLVNNAGVFIPKPFIDYTAADLAMVSAVNLHGFFHISQKAAAWMLKAASGHIVNITASLADQPIASVTAALTALTKGGLNAVTRSLAIEFAGKGIRVNAVSPGVIKTPMHPPEAYPFLAGLHPVGRMGEIHDIVEAVLFLEKASFVTGEILHVDGGANAGHW